MEDSMTSEENLKKLKKSPLLMNFVKKQNGDWNHQQWIELCKDLTSRGYEPIDFDQVGLLLEEKKKKFQSQKT